MKSLRYSEQSKQRISRINVSTYNEQKSYNMEEDRYIEEEATRKRIKSRTKGSLTKNIYYAILCLVAFTLGVNRGIYSMKAPSPPSSNVSHEDNQNNEEQKHFYDGYMHVQANILDVFHEKIASVENQFFKTIESMKTAHSIDNNQGNKLQAEVDSLKKFKHTFHDQVEREDQIKKMQVVQNAPSSENSVLLNNYGEVDIPVPKSEKQNDIVESRERQNNLAASNALDLDNKKPKEDMLNDSIVKSSAIEKKVDLIVPKVPSTLTVSEQSIGYLEMEQLKKIYSSQVENEKLVSSLENKPIQNFLSNPEKHLPIIMLACNRADYMKESLTSLMAVRGVEKKNVHVLQDGENSDVARVAENFGVQLKQHIRNNVPNRGGNLRGAKPDGATLIAEHYYFSLKYAFEANPDAPAIIIIEDDLLYSPDFLEYLEYNAAILEEDETTFLLSAWNDNGFKDLINDPYRLHRTNYFPGLGWLLPRKLFENELQKTWPRQHWDHWLRDKSQHKGRACIHPEVPRTYHMGKKGTFMDESTHAKLFANIGYNTNPDIKWSMKSFSYIPNLQIKGDASSTSMHENDITIKPYWRVFKNPYDSYIKDFISTGITLPSLEEIDTLKETTPENGKHYVVWYKVSTQQKAFESISKYFGIWHEPVRSEYYGIHELYHFGHHTMLINTRNSPYTKISYYAEDRNNDKNIPPNVIIEARTFQKSNVNTMDPRQKSRIEKTLPPEIKSKVKVLYPTEQFGDSCNEVCARNNLKCDNSKMKQYSLFSYISDCKTLKQYFPCASCEQSYGHEQPCYVNPSAPKENFPGSCLISSKPEESTCEASHHLTKRLCPCI